MSQQEQDEDLELQMALALSLQEAQGNAPSQAPAAPAALASTLQQAMQQMFGGGGLPNPPAPPATTVVPPPPSSAPSQPAQHQQAPPPPAAALASTLQQAMQQMFGGGVLPNPPAAPAAAAAPPSAAPQQQGPGAQLSQLQAAFSNAMQQAAGGMGGGSSQGAPAPAFPQQGPAAQLAQLQGALMSALQQAAGAAGQGQAPPAPGAAANPGAGGGLPAGLAGLFGHLLAPPPQAAAAAAAAAGANAPAGAGGARPGTAAGVLSPGGRGITAPLAVQVPDWVNRSKTWWAPDAPAAAGSAGGAAGGQPGTKPADASLPSAADIKAFETAVGTAFGCQVVVATSAAAAAAAGMTSMPIRGTAAGEGVTISVAELKSFVKQWLLRPSMAASGRSQLRCLHDAYDALPAASAVPGAAGPALDVLAGVLGDMALGLLAADEEDLYYEKGQYTGELLRDLKVPSRKGAGMCAPFMDALACAVTSPASADTITKLLRVVFSEFGASKQLGKAANELEPLLLMVDIFTAPPRIQKALVSALCEEVKTMMGGAGRPGTARAIEASSVLGPMLQVSSAVDPLSALRKDCASRAKETFTSLKGWPTNVGEIETTIKVLQGLHSRLQEGAQLLLKRLITLKVADPDGVAVGREAVLAWLAALAEANWERCAMGERGIREQLLQEVTAGGSDGLAVNVTAVCLRFARPFIQGFLDKNPKFGDLFAKHLSPTYWATQLHRVGDLSKTNSLAGERGHSVASAAEAFLSALNANGSTSNGGASTSNGGSGGSALVRGPPGAWLQGPLLPGAAASSVPSFTADIFFLTLKWMHVGLLPALFRFQRLQEVVSHDLMNEGGQSHRRVDPQVALLNCCTSSLLLDPNLVEDTVQFCMVTVAWLVHVARSPPTPKGSGLPGGGPDAFRLIPDWVLSDLLAWLTFIIQSGLAVHVASKDVGSLTSGLVALLDSPACVRSVILHDKIARLLLTMLGPQLNVSRRTALTGSLAPVPTRPGEAALVASVLNSPAAQSGAMAGALMRSYVGADHVVGLDVDRDTFDKFTMRSQIDMILEELWRDERCRRHIVALATQAADAAGASGHPGGEPPVFFEYASCLFNSVIYLFKDSLTRLEDIAKVEAAQRDERGWAARPREERESQEAFKRATGSTCRGFMRMAAATLAWLNTLTEHPQAGAAFCRPPLAGRVAYSILHFAEILLSDKAARLVVDKPEQYYWDRKALLSSCVGLLLRLAASPGRSSFVEAVAAEPDLDLGLMEQAQAALEGWHLPMPASQLGAFITELRRVAGVPAAAGKLGAVSPGTVTGDGLSGKPPPAKRSRTSNEGANNNGSDAAGGPADMETEEAAGPVGASGGAGALAGLPALPPPDLSGPELESGYKEALEELSMGTFDHRAPRAYHSAFASMAAADEEAPPAKMKRLTRELRDLNGKTRLPCAPAAAIFLRHDADRVDIMRALVTGPEGTPYAYGCFCFDLFFPPGYPNTAMLVNFETTGQGRARFNPNLYADGKVCLSLINTWHAGHESEKWNPDQTTTFQVLVSIQAMILVEDPYYNEPAHEATRGTDTGKSSAAAYNAELTLNTLRYAMIDKLRNPPPGLEDVVRRHFRLLRHKVMATALKWAQAAAATGDPLLGSRTEKAVRELHGLLAAL